MLDNDSDIDFEIESDLSSHAEMSTLNLLPGNSTGNLMNAVSKSHLSAVNHLEPKNPPSRHSSRGSGVNLLPGNSSLNLMPGNTGLSGSSRVNLLSRVSASNLNSEGCTLNLLTDNVYRRNSTGNIMPRGNNMPTIKTNDMDRERTEVLERFAGIKTESKVQMEALEKLSQNNTELKLLLERSEHQRDKLSDRVFKLKTSNEAKNQHIGNLESDLSTCHRQLTSLENDRSQSSKRYENNENVIKDIRKELAEVKNLYSQSELRYKEIEKSKQELKEKAVHTLKEYRLKCKRYEQRCDDLSEQVKLKDANLAKESSRAKEIEIANLKLQKEYQDLSCEFENLQQQFSGRDKRLSQLLDDRNHVEHVLQEANHASKANNELRKEIQDLKNDKMTLNSQLLDEKRKVKEFESLLHENYERQLETKDSVTSLQRQLQEERQMKTELASRLQQEKNSSARHDVRRLEERNTKLESDKNEMHQKLIKLEKLQEDFSRNMQFFEKDKSDSETKEKALTQKLKKSSDDTSRMRKQYQSMKKTYEEKIQELRTSVTKSEEQMSILQNHSNEYQSEISKLKDVIKVIISLVTRDLENLLNLLCREDENMMPVKEIPDSMSPEHQKSLHEIREKIQSCYSISKTLKQKFQHQKSFVRKAQEKIKKQSHEQESFKEELSSENEKLTHHIHKLEKNRTIHEEDRKRIAHLQRQVKELTKHLEECTNALEKSLSFEEDRRKVLKELDELKNEHQERQKTDESYYRNNEKVDILTEQLNDAKKTLEDVKQETLDSTVFTSRVLESFSSVSPSCRKRSLLSQATPKLKSSRGSLFRDSSSYIPTYIDELESTPTRDVHKRRTPPTKGRRKEPVPDLNDVDPMSMTDDEFDKIFMPKKTNSDHSSPLHLPKAGQMTNGIGGPDTNHPLGS
ncbi:uncharacterized protein [Clytia hemisphaerica]|uniref:uncharacterized protein isoform X2 n=1 Tax=Clytia hemisphaerica TaxID=252671 RepID=UPI0034D4B0B1